VCAEGYGVSNHAAATRAKPRCRHRWHSALLAVASWTRDHERGRACSRSTGPKERRDPADNRPTEKEIQQKDAERIALVVADDRRQKIQENQNKQAHKRTSLSEVTQWLGQKFRFN